MINHQASGHHNRQAPVIPQHQHPKSIPHQHYNIDTWNKMRLQNASRLLRQPLTQQCLFHSSTARPMLSLIQQHRFASSARRPASSNAQSSQQPADTNQDPIAQHRKEAEEREYHKRRTYYAGAGTVVTILLTWLIVANSDLDRNDAAPEDTMAKLDRGTPVISGAEKDAEEEKDVVATGSKHIPYIPRTLTLPLSTPTSTTGAPTSSSSAPATQTSESYSLLGHGIRTVSFLGIQVYIAGLYISAPSLSALHSTLIDAATPTETSATTLVGPEKDALRSRLLDADGSEEVWGRVLRDSGAKMVLRITPTRNTDFHHLRDAWVRAVTSRTQKALQAAGGHGAVTEFDDDKFGAAMAEFKRIFGGGARKNVPKAKSLLLVRDGSSGVLQVLYDGSSTPQGAQAHVDELVELGRIEDERVGRALLLHYLAGPKVATEELRANVVNGVMDVVERPVGTV
ncbi:MAG: hypothetical protein M1819_003837 [Sarea resinae]|nr:MAG: hypothetical protein M1819_003837 [Sarea resinae]